MLILCVALINLRVGGSLVLLLCELRLFGTEEYAKECLMCDAFFILIPQKDHMRVVTTFCTWLPYNKIFKNAIFTMDFAVDSP